MDHNIRPIMCNLKTSYNNETTFFVRVTIVQTTNRFSLFHLSIKF